MLETLKIAVMDWWQDHQNDPEYADLVIEYDGADLDDNGQWYIPAHDSTHSYELLMNTDGDIYIV